VKMLPALQTLTTSINSIQYHAPVMENVYSILHDNITQDHISNESDDSLGKTAFDTITFDRVTFIYPNRSVPALADLSISIKRNEVVGIIGTSGAGKSTFVDLILGLMHPTNGRILVDDKALSDFMSGWRSNIGYVPQSINLLDDSVKNNILFG